MTQDATLDWRAEAELTDSDPDDAELETTPVEVVTILGFDPLDEKKSKKKNERRG